MKRCETCEFSTGNSAMYCRRYPPQQVTGVEHFIFYEWPNVLPTSWCGEWKPKTKTNNPTVDAQCVLCGESKPFPAALVPIQPKPRVCAECAEKETTDAE